MTRGPQKGDVDTVACIAGTIGSLGGEITQDIPKDRYETLEDEPYGKTYLAISTSSSCQNFAD